MSNNMNLLPPQVSQTTGAYPSDLTHAVTMNGGPSSSTPTRKEPKPAIDTKRKQTLLNLLDILAELQKDGESTFRESIPHSKVEKLEEPMEAADEQLQKLGAESFFKFQKRINNLDRELRNFANASRQLGSSVGILSSAFYLRERLVQVLFLFRENAADLFPRRVQRQSAESYVDQKHRMEESSTATGKPKPRHRRPLPHIARPALPKEMDVEEFPTQLETFAKDVSTFLKSLNEFPEFTDEAVNNSMNSFESDLKYWASCLRTYEGQFKYPAVQRYLHDLCAEMGDHLDTITSSLSMFLEIGIPTIRFAQKHAAANLLNLSTVATFFSAVTATTLQFSFDTTGSPVADAVNSFWFLSLVFSIASAVNSLLGVTWKQAMYRSPGHRVPWWVLIWIKRSPLIFLVISVAAFSVGLCLFAYSSNQSPVTSALTTVFTCFSSFGLVAVSAWFVFERWTFSRHLGKKWLMDVLTEVNQEFYRLPLISWLVLVPHMHAKRVATSANRQLTRVGTGLSMVGTKLSMVGTKLSKTVLTRKKSHGDDETDDAERGNVAAPLGMSAELHSNTASPSTVFPSAEHVGSPTPASPTSPTPLPSSKSVTSLCTAPSEAATSTESVSVAFGGPGKRRFASAVRTVMSANRALGMNSPVAVNGPSLMSPRRQRTKASTMDSGSATLSGGGAGDEQAASSTMRVSRVATLIPALKSLRPMQFFQPHTALVRHLQFSPNGEFLATCSWDRTCLIFKVKDFSQPHRVLAHPQGFVGQVAWSPKGDLLLTKMVRGMRIWTADSGVCRKTIDRQRSVQSVTWFPQGEAFLSVEDSNVTKMDLNGKIIETYTFQRMILHDVAITNDQQRMLCVATLTASPHGLKPSVSREEKQIIVYNLDKKEIENQVPILHEVRDITLARSGNVALVSYENKAPPQLWKLETVKDRTNETAIVRLSLVRTYMPKSPVDFAGPSYFGGKDDQLVLCAGKSGEIHIWDRGSGYLLHSFQAQDLDNNLTCIAWNHAASPFMFSTGSHDGTVRIWTSSGDLFPRNSYIDLRQSGANTPRTITPPPTLHPSFTLEITDRTDGMASPDGVSLSSRTPSVRGSIDGRTSPVAERRANLTVTTGAPMLTATVSRDN
ncbi:hypothetical protein M0805_008482 [Coniferiporia weirii]|nr:hypothetical protein M0805_008482 [Coniferiporia weirii]